MRITRCRINAFRNQIQRKGQRNKPLSECQQRRNTRIARTRARVEHPLAAITQMGGKLIRTIGQARASFAMTMMAACYDLERLIGIGAASLPDRSPPTPPGMRVRTGRFESLRS